MPSHTQKRFIFMPIRIGNKILTGKNKNVGNIDHSKSVPSKVQEISQAPTDTTKTDDGYIRKGIFKLSVKSKNIEQDSIFLNTNKTHKLFFYSTPRKDSFLYKRSDLATWDVKKAKCWDEEQEKYVYKDVHLPQVIDTEFYTDKTKLSQQTRTGISTQVKGIDTDAPKTIFWHLKHACELNEARENNGLKPLPSVNSQAHFVDYLNNCGINAKIINTTSEKIKYLPKLYQTTYAHFATAELLLIFSGSMRDEILQMIEQNKLQSRRRIFASEKIKGSKNFQISDWVEFQNHAVEIDGIQYAIRFRIIDTCAIHGIAGYGDIAKNVGWKLTAKDNFTKAQKGRMLEMALNYPVEFEEYSLGDLDVYEILEAYDKKWREIYEILGLSNDEQDYYQEPKLTIGGTVKDLFLAKLAQKLNIKDELSEKGKVIEKWQKKLKTSVLDKYLNFNPGEIRQYFKSTKCLLSKVEGGRCRNNRPTDIFVCRKNKGKYDASLICDIDISGCYGEGQRNQLFFIGVPVTFGMEISKYNEYPSLRQILTELKVNIDLLCKRNREDWLKPENWGELIPGGWVFRWGIREPLKYGQDLFASWFTKSGHGTDVMAKFIKDNESNDSELTDKQELIDFDEEYGTIKIFEHETFNSVLTHDGLQWLFGVASPRQRNEILDKGMVLCGAYYPRSQELKIENWDNAITELDSVYESWEGVNSYELSDNSVINKDNSCHSWISINLGELIVNDLLIERKKAQITHGKKSPLDQLFKLCVNTLYGDMVSKYFVTSNPIVGNNITARARLLAWYMEKGFNGWQTITDGCGFLLNEVLKAGKSKLDGETTISERDKRLKSWNIFKSPLNDVEEYLMLNGEIFVKQNDELKSIGKGSDNGFINQKAWEHLQNQFECVDILHSESSKITVNKDDLSVSFLTRKGQFSFETKDVYWRGAFHGSANYILEKEIILISGIDAESIKGDELIKSEGLKEKHPCLDIIRKNTNNPLDWEITTYQVIKMRGYEVGKTHEGWINNDSEDIDTINLIESERYGSDNSPAKDFMIQLLENSESIKRQQTAIKEGILKISEYQERTETFKNNSIVPGDSIKKSFLMAEYSQTQFTFKNYEQFIGWDKPCSSDKDKYSQSLESFFLNKNGSLNFKKLVDWVYENIQNETQNPLELLDQHNNRSRASKKTKKNNGNGKSKNTVNINHPSRIEYERIKELLKGE
ncbi:hypothetical protein H6G64_35325 [Calothrix sp. FACHB-156]|nr:hypothetical protein [Calothrix sp. FACHB-156]